MRRGILMKFVQALKPMKSNELFSFRIFILTMITFLVHLALMFSIGGFPVDYANNSASTVRESALTMVLIVFFIYLIFVFVPSWYIFRTQIPLLVKYTFIIMFPIFIFSAWETNFSNVNNFIQYFRTNKMASTYMIYTLPLLCIIEIYGRLHKMCERKAKAESE